MPGRRVLPAALLFALVTAGCSDPVSVPDVVGLALDDAHDELEEAGFEDFEDSDALSDRTIFLDRNWVVLEQEPGGSSSETTGTTVALRVGHIDEDRDQLIDLLPDDSPVLEEIEQDLQHEADDAAEQTAEDEREQQERAAEDVREAEARRARVLDYVNAVDPFTRLAQTDLPELAAVAAEARAGDLTGDSVLLEVVDAKDALSSYWTAIELLEPDSDTGLGDAQDELLAALNTFDQAAGTLLSVTGPDSTSSLDRFDTVYAQAAAEWNRALTAIYGTTDIPAPLLG